MDQSAVMIAEYRLLRGYSTGDEEGLRLWENVLAARDEQPIGFSDRGGRYGEPTLIRPRLGQGAFRLLVTDLYSRRWAITGERTLPALEAAYIKPYAEVANMQGQTES